MLHRRPTAIAAPLVGLVLAASLSACGFHYPTDRVNLISAGENNRDHSVYALGMRVLSDHPGEGRLIGNLSNEEDSPATLSSVSLPDGITTPGLQPIKLGPRGDINLATDADVELAGDITPGTVLVGVKLDVTRSGRSETIEMNIPVVKDCHQYTAVPTPTPSTQSSSSATPSTSATSPKSTKSSASAAVSSSSTSSSTSSATPTPSATGSAPTASTGADNAWACTWTTPSDSE